jgi:excisionase family DNA binding protein
VTTFRHDHDIAVYEEGEVEKRGEMFLDQAAARLGVHKSKIYKLIRQGLLPATQVCQGAPWILSQDVLMKHESFLGGNEMGSSKAPLTSAQVNLFSEKTTT